MRVVIKGAGDIATGIAVRLFRARFQVILTEVARPTAVRRTVSFAEAVWEGTATVEGVEAMIAPSVAAAAEILHVGRIPVLVDPEAECVSWFRPDVVVDAVLAKQNLGTDITDAPLVIAVGPGFLAGVDCHAVIETQRGHDLGRVILEGGAAPNTGVPAEIGGHDKKRVLRAPASGMFLPVVEMPIGTRVRPGDVVGWVDDASVVVEIDGILRGVLAPGVPVSEGMKCGDVDPRCELDHCYTISDKARAVGGGVLEAILRLYPGSVTLG